MKKHVETIHNGDKKTQLIDTNYHVLISKITELQSKLEERDEKQKERDEKLTNEIEKLKNKPNNQVLQIVCVSSNDNYLDMLTDRMGNFDQAIAYIKDCALSDLIGDCKLIEKIYKNQDDELAFSIDRKNTKIFYNNDHNQPISENRDIFGRKLANNLQNSYLKGINHLINKNLDMKRDPNKFLDDYDIMTWNTHIYHLSDIDHQRKILSRLALPVSSNT
jgi:hypothetical protein